MSAEKFEAQKIIAADRAIARVSATVGASATRHQDSHTTAATNTAIPKKGKAKASHKGEHKTYHLKNPEQITANIAECEYFEDLLSVLYSPSWDTFNNIHVSATFNRWSQLWHSANLMVNAKDNKISIDAKKAWEDEITLMSDHLAGKTFAALIKKAKDMLNEFKEANLSSIANAISNLPITESSLQLLTNIVTTVISLGTLRGFMPLGLSILAKAVAKVTPNTDTTQTLINNIAEHINSLASLQPYTGLPLGYIAYAINKVPPNTKTKTLAIRKIATHFNNLPPLTNESGYSVIDLAYIAEAAANLDPESETSKLLIEEIATYINNIESLAGLSHHDLVKFARAAVKIAPTAQSCQRLINKISTHINGLKSFQQAGYNPQYISYIAYAVVKAAPMAQTSQALLKKIATHISALPSLQGYEPEQLASIAHSMAKAGLEDKTVFQKLSVALVQLDPAKLPVECITSIYQFFLYAHSKSITVASSDIFLKTCKEQLDASLTTNTSRFQRSVFHALLLLQDPELQLIEEYTAVGSCIDIAILSNASKIPFKIAVEVYGPTHYEPNTQKFNQNTLFKIRLLESQGWQVIGLPFFDLYPFRTKGGTIEKKPLIAYLNETVIKPIQALQSKQQQKSEGAQTRTVPVSEINKEVELKERLDIDKSLTKLPSKDSAKAAPSSTRAQSEYNSSLLLFSHSQPCIPGFIKASLLAVENGEWFVASQSYLRISEDYFIKADRTFNILQYYFNTKPKKYLLAAVEQFKKCIIARQQAIKMLEKIPREQQTFEVDYPFSLQSGFKNVLASIKQALNKVQLKATEMQGRTLLGTEIEINAAYKAVIPELSTLQNSLEQYLEKSVPFSIVIAPAKCSRTKRVEP